MKRLFDLVMGLMAVAVLLVPLVVVAALGLVAIVVSGDALCQPGVDWQVWIAGDSRLPQKIVITNVDDPALPEFRAQLDWDVHTPVPESTFRFEAPKDAASIVLKLPADSDNTH